MQTFCESHCLAELQSVCCEALLVKKEFLSLRQRKLRNSG
jgi:hypothetical protein